MNTLRDISRLFAALANTPAGAKAVEVMTARNYGMLLAAVTVDPVDLEEVGAATVVYTDGLHDTLLYNGPTARDARFLSEVREAMAFLEHCDVPGYLDRAYEGLQNALYTYNR